MKTEKRGFKKYQLICGLETEHNIFFKFKNKKIDDKDIISSIKNTIENIILKEIDKEIIFIKDCHDFPMGGFSRKNAGRFYPDIGNTIETATPECPTVKNLLLYHQIQESILVKVLSKIKKEECYITLFKETSDRNGQTIGSHESYYIQLEKTIGVDEINDINYTTILKNVRELLPHLIPFLIVRPLICGAGKISKETPRALKKYGVSNFFEDKFSFQISQRSDYIERIFKGSSSQDGFFSIKPEINFQNPENFCNGYRLHIAGGDSNRCPLSLFLRMGSTALVIKTLKENGFKDLPPEIVDKKLLNYLSKRMNKYYINEEAKTLGISKLDMAKPFIDLAMLSRDSALKNKFKTQDGKEFTALEIHLWYLKQIKEHLVLTGQFEGEFKEIWDIWNDVVQALLAGDFKKLFGIVDWITLKLALDCVAQNKGIRDEAYENPEIRKLEASYFNLDNDPNQSLFSLLKNKGKIKMVFDETELENGKNLAPRSRADFRKFIIDLILKYFGGKCKNINNMRTAAIEEIRWNELKFFVYFTGYQPTKSEIRGIIYPEKQKKSYLPVTIKINPSLSVYVDNNRNYIAADGDSEPKISELKVIIGMETPYALDPESYRKTEQIIRDLSRLTKRNK